MEPDRKIYDPRTLVDLYGPLYEQLLGKKGWIHTDDSDKATCYVELNGIEPVTLRAISGSVQHVPSVIIRLISSISHSNLILPSATIHEILKCVQVLFDPYRLEDIPVSNRTITTADMTPENSLLFQLRADALPREQWELERMDPPPAARLDQKSQQQQPQACADLKALYDSIVQKPAPQDPSLVDRDRVPDVFKRGLRNICVGDLKWRPRGSQLGWSVYPEFPQGKAVVFTLAPQDQVNIMCYAYRAKSLLSKRLKTDEVAQPGLLTQRMVVVPSLKRGMVLKPSQKVNVFKKCITRPEASIPVFDLDIRVKREKKDEDEEKAELHNPSVREIEDTVEFMDIDNTDRYDVTLRVARPWACTRCRLCGHVMDLKEKKGSWVVPVQSSGVLDPKWIFRKCVNSIVSEYAKKVYDPAEAVDLAALSLSVPKKKGRAHINLSN